MICKIANHRKATLSRMVCEKTQDWNLGCNTVMLLKTTYGKGGDLIVGCLKNELSKTV